MAIPNSRTEREYQRFEEDEDGKPAVRVVNKLSNFQNGITKLEYDANGNLIYVGINKDRNALTSQTDWVIKKFVYDVNGNLTDILIKKDSWDNRTTGW